ncbi:MAG: response regulator [Verrucomicrobiales bacterium]|nr:response regulator [Verrucomicrobiales bacterium]
MTPPRILCVDDEPNVISGFQRALRHEFQIEGCTDGSEALSALDSKGPFPVLVADMHMPGMNGVELLRRAAEKFPDTVRIMLTGNPEQRTAAEAVNQGQVFRFLTKPCDPKDLSAALRAGLQQYHLALAEKELLENTLHGAVKALVDILSMVDPLSFGLGQTLREDMRGFLQFLGKPGSWEYEIAAMLSQIGYVTVPQFVVKRSRASQGLTAPEKQMIARVPFTGSELVATIPRLEGVAQIILYQRKNFDGSGFPIDTTAGEDIPLGARILRVLIDLHELETRGASRGNGLLILRERAGTYDPKVLEALAKCFDTHLPKTPATTRTLLLRIRDLEPGHILASDLTTLGGILIVPAGQRLTTIIIEKIRNFDKVSGVREPIAVEAPASGPASNGAPPESAASDEARSLSA